MRILPMLLAISTFSCILQRTEQGKSKGWWQGIVPAGCVEQLSFTREDDEGFLGELAVVHKRYDYKDKQGCETSVTISSDVDFGDAIALMDTKEISCSTASDGSLVLNFPHDKDKKYPLVKFPCNTKEISIARISSWSEMSKLIEEGKPSTSLTTDEQQDLGFWWRLGDLVYGSLLHGTMRFAHGYGELFSDHYRTFRKKVLGGLAIVYAEHQQAPLRNPLNIVGAVRKSGTKKHPYGAVGVSKEGFVVYHIMVDSKGKKQMLYPQKTNP